MMNKVRIRSRVPLKIALLTQGSSIETNLPPPYLTGSQVGSHIAFIQLHRQAGLVRKLYVAVFKERPVVDGKLLPVSQKDALPPVWPTLNSCPRKSRIDAAEWADARVPIGLATLCALVEIVEIRQVGDLLASQQSHGLRDVDLGYVDALIHDKWPEALTRVQVFPRKYRNRGRCSQLRPGG